MFIYTKEEQCFKHEILINRQSDTLFITEESAEGEELEKTVSAFPHYYASISQMVETLVERGFMSERSPSLFTLKGRRVEEGSEEGAGKVMTTAT